MAAMMLLVERSPISSWRKPATIPPPTPPAITMKKVRIAVPMPRNRGGNTACTAGCTKANAPLSKVALRAANTMNNPRFGIEYWIGMSTPMGSNSTPIIRIAFWGSRRYVASNHRPTTGMKTRIPRPAGATASPLSRALSPNSSSKKNDWIELAGKRANPIAAKATVIFRMKSMLQMRAKAASTEIGILSSCSKPAPSTCSCSHRPRGGSRKKKAKKASAAVGSPSR